MYIAAPPTLPIACHRSSPVSSSIRFSQYPAFIGKHAGGEQKGNTVFFPIQAVLSFVPFQPHVYIVYIYLCRGIKFKSRRTPAPPPRCRRRRRGIQWTLA